jgi:hypothetical protein
MNKEDHVWISFVEGLHKHAAIVMYLMCSVFCLMSNYIEMGSLKRKDFKLAGVLDHKKHVMTPSKHLYGILDNCFEAQMLIKPFSVQVLFLKQNNSQIHKMMTTLKKTSEWISNNKNFPWRNNFNMTIRRTYKNPAVLQMQTKEEFLT